MKSAKKLLVVALLVLPMVFASTAFTQNVGTDDDHELNLRAYVELLRADVKAKRVAIITEIMQFNDSDAAKFWPIFRQYDLDLTTLGDGRVALIEDYTKNYANITNEKSDELMSKAFELEGQRAALKKRYFDTMKVALSARQAAQFFQAENQMQYVVDLQISSHLPAMQ
jgi:hypothetical protein